MKKIVIIKVIIITTFFIILACADYKTKENSQVSDYNKGASEPIMLENAIEESEADDGVYAEQRKMKKKENPPVEHNTEEYDKIIENEFKDVKENPLSTFSIDVDNASYSNIRRHLSYNQLPPKGAVRIEEMINYFNYDYPDPKGKHPFSFITEISSSPWSNENKLIHIGIQGKKLDYNDIKPSNFVFLIDVSGSMEDPNKLPLLRKSFGMLLNKLDDRDKISIVVYAGAAGLIMSPTPASERRKIKEALNSLTAGGSTAGGDGIKLAYKIAKENIIADGNNRVIQTVL